MYVYYTVSTCEEAELTWFEAEAQNEVLRTQATVLNYTNKAHTHRDQGARRAKKECKRAHPTHDATPVTQNKRTIAHTRAAAKARRSKHMYAQKTTDTNTSYHSGLN